MQQPIYHLVNLYAKAPGERDESKLNELIQSMLGLKETCLRDGKPYMTVVGGKDMSIEGAQGGITHSFVMTFDSLEDRDFYVNEDSAHAACRRMFAEYWMDTLVDAKGTDFVPGEF